MQETIASIIASHQDKYILFNAIDDIGNPIVCLIKDTMAASIDALLMAI